MQPAWGPRGIWLSFDQYIGRLFVNMKPLPTLCFVSNETKDEDIVQHRDVVESRAIAHMKDIEKLFFVLKFHESRSNSLSFTKI